MNSQSDAAVDADPYENWCHACEGEPYAEHIARIVSGEVA